ncbi:hypothetical protein BC832DRAFT_543457 [Gaertneriomyces semiglobifer]|nr:hypothetical protein BC832DRAFT_543457 [Gaertneriomyces semiglobifer]
MYTFHRGWTFAAVLGGMFTGSAFIHRLMKPDMSVPDILADEPAKVSKNETTISTTQ